MGGLSIQGWLFPSEADRIWGINNEGILAFGLNSLVLSATAATLATLLAMGPLYLPCAFPAASSMALLTLSRSPLRCRGSLSAWPLCCCSIAGSQSCTARSFALVFAFIFRLLPQSLSTGEVGAALSGAVVGAGRALPWSIAAYLRRDAAGGRAGHRRKLGAGLYHGHGKSCPPPFLPDRLALTRCRCASGRRDLESNTYPGRPPSCSSWLTTLTLLPLMHSRFGIDRLAARQSVM